MDLLTYFKSLPKDTRADFAERCGTTEGHLRNVAYSCKTCAAELAVNIERESGGLVRVEEIRDDIDWSVIRGNPQAA